MIRISRPWLAFAAVMTTALVTPLGAQVAPVLDPLRLTQPRQFEAFRASSNNPDLDSNDDSKRPLPGETVVLADLKGPGVITHMWITVAANEYAWPRLLRIRGKVSVQREVFWGKDILFFEAEGPGARLDVPFDVPEDGRYELVAQVAGAPDYGTYTMLIDGKVPGNATELEHEPGANTGNGPSFDGYYTELFVGEDRVIGWPRLTKGRHTISFVCTGKNASSTKYFLGLDGLVLARVAGERVNGSADSTLASNPADRLRAIGGRGPAAAAQLPALRAGLASSTADDRIAAAWAFTQLGRAARPAADALTHALGDADHVVRGLAALALRDAGPLPDASIDALAGRLTDADDGVRMASAWAIAAQGPRAMRVFPALMAAGRADPQHPHAQRAVADAFGAIGPAAREALPVLEVLARGPRVRWNATAAMRRVRGEVPGAR